MTEKTKGKTKRFQPGMKVTAMGLGRFGGQLAAIRHLAEQGAEVLVTDQADAETLQESVQRLADLRSVTYRWGPHQRSDFQSADLVLVSPAVKPNHPCLLAALQKNIPIITEVELLLQNCQARLIGVTGTVGKSTVTTMLAHLLARQGNTVYAGGNLGHSLLPQVRALQPTDFVILELSSFQLHWLKQLAPRFEIAILTSFYPHHLQWHDTVQAYQACKQVLFSGQQPTDLAVIPEKLKNDPHWHTTAQTVHFGPPADAARGDIADQTEVDSFPVPTDWPRHQQENTAAVLQAAEFLGIEAPLALTWLSDYQRLPHRLERLGDFAGRKVINDSKATSPWATAAALEENRGPLWLILGGAENADNPELLFQALRSLPRLKGLCWMGPGGRKWQEQFSSSAPDFSTTEKCSSTAVDTLAEAWGWIWPRSVAGDTLLMSPGCPSFNEFQHYEQRGEALRLLAETQSRTTSQLINPLI